MGLVEKFYNEALCDHLGAPVDREFLSHTFDECKEGGFALINKEGKCIGVLAGKTVNIMVNNTKVFQEAVWYVDPEYRMDGIKMLKTAQSILFKEGYQLMVMVCLHNSKTEKLHAFYERLGYKPMETHYTLMLQGDRNA